MLAAATSTGDAVLDVLAALGVRGATSRGVYVRALCPFHGHASERTFWMVRATGVWGCWSTRCMQHEPTPVRVLFELRGYPGHDAEEAARRFATLPAAPRVERLDPNRLREPHLALWRVDWQAALRFLHAYAACGSEGQAAAACGLDPGRVERGRWRDLFYLLGTRRCTPDALVRMSVGFDPRLGRLTFPIRDPGGELRGVASREPRDGRDYVICGSYLDSREQGYVYHHVEREDCLCGWAEQVAEIEAGREVVVVEGYVDQLRLLGAGLCVVAKFGSRLTASQAALLRSVPNPVVIWGDNDVAGIRGMVRDTVGLLGRPGVRCAVAGAWGQDPADLADDACEVVGAATSAAIFLGRAPGLIGAGAAR